MPAYIEEYQTIANAGAEYGPPFAGLQAPQEPSITHQTVTIQVSPAVASNPFNAATRFIRIEVDAICSIAIGAPGTVADTTCKRLIAGQWEYFGVRPGHIVSVIGNV